MERKFLIKFHLSKEVFVCSWRMDTQHVSSSSSSILAYQSPWLSYTLRLGCPLFTYRSNYSCLLSGRYLETFLVSF